METFTIFSFTIYDLLTTNHLGTIKRLKKVIHEPQQGTLQYIRTKNEEQRQKKEIHEPQLRQVGICDRAQ